MPQFPLKDNFGLDLGVNLEPSSALVRYFRDISGAVILHLDFKSIIDQPLTAYPFGAVAVDLGFDKGFTGELPGAEITVGPGIHGSLTVVTHGTLFDPDPYGSPVSIAADHAYLGFGLTVGFSAAVTNDALNPAFGFTLGTGVTLSNYQLFATTPSTPLIGAALSDVIGKWIIPAALPDLDSMPEGLIATVEGSGVISFTAQVDVAPLINPLASASIALAASAIEIQAGASIPVTASYTLKGEYQVRVQKLDANRVAIGYLRKQGQNLTVTAAVAAGVTATAGGASLVGGLLSALSPDPEIDLAGMNLDPAVLAAITNALESSIERELELSIQAQLDFLSSSAEAFLFEVDLDALDAAGQAMVEEALRSNLSPLVQNEKSLPPGITWKSSVVTKARERGFSLNVNVFGFFNWASVRELLTNSIIAADPASGSVVITDRVTASRIGLTSNLITERNQMALRSVLGESFLLTAVYRSTNVLSDSAITGLYWFFDLDPSANQAAIDDHLNAIRALGIALPQAHAQTPVKTSFGRTAFFLETRYDVAATNALFVKSNGSARASGDYERAGREAMRAVLLPGGVNAVRREALDDAWWPQVRASAGSFEALSQLFPSAAEPAIADIAGDWFVITNWASAMAEASKTLAAARPWLATHPDPASPEFESLRARIEKQMASLARETINRFSEPWGIVALDLASDRASQASAELYSSALTLVLKR